MSPSVAEARPCLAVSRTGGARERTLPQRPIYQLKAEFLKSLAHPLRIRVLELLIDGEKTVAELIVQTGAEASHLSQQLGILRAAGVLVSRREGSSVHYTVRDPRIFHLLATAKEILTSSLEHSNQLLSDLHGLEFGVGEQR